MTFTVQTINNIAASGLQKFAADRYRIGADIENPHAIILRSQDLHGRNFDANLLAVGRAGAGTNNIPLSVLSELGVPVFNAPGANANAVKELVLGCLLMAERNLHRAVQFGESLEDAGDALNLLVEEGKKRFVGRELPRRTLGVIGLGAIGVEVANAAAMLGMRVVGYDPAITVESAWRLSPEVQKAGNVEALLSDSDFVTVHVPLVPSTCHLLNTERLRLLPSGATVVNLARAEIVDELAMLAALDSGSLKAYISDFPSVATIRHNKVITLPHLGASTVEAEENCAIMVADQLCAFLERGHIANSVNFPTVQLPRKSEYRIAVCHQNVPDMLGQVSHALGRSHVNILHLINESRGELAYTLIDAASAVDQITLASIGDIKGVLKVRQL